jgi:hypothetical protein
VDWTGGLLLHGPSELGRYRTSSVSWVEPERSVARGCVVIIRLFPSASLGDPLAPGGAMELPAALSRAPTRPQAWAVEGACPESRHHAEADTGPPPPRSPAFYSSVFAQVRQPLDGMPAPTGATRESFFAFRFSICDAGYSLTCARADRRDRVGAAGELHWGRWRLLPDLPRPVKSFFLYYICISCMPV